MVASPMPLWIPISNEGIERTMVIFVPTFMKTVVYGGISLQTVLGVGAEQTAAEVLFGSIKLISELYGSIVHVTFNGSDTSLLQEVVIVVVPFTLLI